MGDAAAAATASAETAHIAAIRVAAKITDMLFAGQKYNVASHMLHMPYYEARPIQPCGQWVQIANQAAPQSKVIAQ